MPSEPDRVALITGAARGIGAATARALAGDGWRVGLVDVLADELAATRAACGPDALAFVADVRGQAALDAAVGETVERFGRLDAAVSVAGIVAGGPPAWASDDETWSDLLDVNLSGVWRLARAAVPALLAAPPPRRGRFVAVSSAAGIKGLPKLAAYCASKHGVIGFVRAMAAELGASQVTANVVCPGSTDTAMLAETVPIYDLPGPEAFAVHQPIGRLLAPAEVAAAIAWLCGEHASGLTGAVVPVDGGMTAT
jgi:SDR family mycofactocin-dependent oxidoreductase